MFLPTVLEKMSGAGSMVSYDLFSRLLKDRIVFVGDEEGVVNTLSANVIISQLLYLQSENSDGGISMYINSPGGSVLSGLAIYDTMQYISAPVSTICIGHAMSFGALLLAAGTKGHRYALPNSRIMIHQPLIHGGGISGQATDIEIEAKEMSYHKNKLAEILAFHCDKKVSKIKEDMERNYYMSAEEAKEYGLIDAILERKNR